VVGSDGREVCWFNLDAFGSVKISVFQVIVGWEVGVDNIELCVLCFRIHVPIADDTVKGTIKLSLVSI